MSSPLGLIHCFLETQLVRPTNGFQLASSSCSYSRGAKTQPDFCTSISATSLWTVAIHNSTEDPSKESRLCCTRIYNLFVTETKQKSRSLWFLAHIMNISKCGEPMRKSFRFHLHTINTHTQVNIAETKQFTWRLPANFTLSPLTWQRLRGTHTTTNSFTASSSQNRVLYPFQFAFVATTNDDHPLTTSPIFNTAHDGGGGAAQQRLFRHLTD